MLRKSVYPKIESLLNNVAGQLQKQGFTPNQLTLAGLAVNFLAGCVYATGNFFLAGIIVMVAALGDLLDGPLARTSGKVTRFGAFLDSTVDRYSDFCLFGGLAVAYAYQGRTGSLLLALGILAGSFVTSYSKARAENLIPDCSVGIFERAERVILLIVGSLFWPLMPFILWILFLGTNGTAVHRILHTRKVLSENPKS